jgi:hypothetical protein
LNQPRQSSLIDGKILGKTRFRAVWRPASASKPLMLRNYPRQIPYATEQRNKSDEQGVKTDDQRVKSAEQGAADFVRALVERVAARMDSAPPHQSVGRV